MNSRQHWEKAMRLEATRDGKLSAAEDYEMIFWSTTHAGAQLLNVVYHGAELTPPDRDMIHTFVPDFVPPMNPDVYEFYITLKEIENMIPLFVRGATPCTSFDIDLCLRKYDILKTIASNYLK